MNLRVNTISSYKRLSASSEQSVLYLDIGKYAKSDSNTTLQILLSCRIVRRTDLTILILEHSLIMYS